MIKYIPISENYNPFETTFLTCPKRKMMALELQNCSSQRKINTAQVVSHKPKCVRLPDPLC